MRTNKTSKIKSIKFDPNKKDIMTTMFESFGIKVIDVTAYPKLAKKKLDKPNKNIKKLK